MKSIILSILLLFSNIVYSKTFSVIIPFSPGGPTDLLWRTIEPSLNERLSSHGIKLITENLPGAGGTIAANKIAATTDKLILGFFSPSLAISGAMNPEIARYDSKSFRLVGYAGETEMFVVSKWSSEDFMKRCHSQGLLFGSSNVGSTSHLLGTIVGKDLNCKSLTHVSYKGLSAAYLDLYAGRIDFIVDFAISAESQSSGGKVKKLFPIDERYSTRLESWHVFVSNNYNDRDIEIIKTEFNNLKKDRSFVSSLERTMRIQKFSMIKDQTWLSNEFENYKNFIKDIK